ncbi:unnamed protein product [Paramecium sonneborni]|uniref:Transmembrane protein n=1 Tax=Paramecium sonneborni TaxID=65129 RepID=A0A8S1QU48_9CILI|nr:unnamed protein product [Paramecium sonneborni]
MKSDCMHNSNYYNKHSIAKLLNKQKCQTFTDQHIYTETKEEFHKRQRDYDQLYKYSCNPQEIAVTSKYKNYSSAANQIKQVFLQRRENLKNFFIDNDKQADQQQKSIQTIAEFLRNQKKLVQDKQITFEPKMQQFNLILILAILLPILCFLTVLAELR